MTATKVLNCRLNEVLSNKFDVIKIITGYDSDSECIRYLINITFDEKINKINPNNIRIENAMNKLKLSQSKFIKNPKYK